MASAAALLLLLVLSPLSFLCAAVTFPLQDVVLEIASQSTLPPDEDPFYKPPPGFETAAPGAILRHRAVPNASSPVKFHYVL